jgi:cell division inhibitor SepF
MTVWKKAMNYLGLGPDDAYDDYDLPPVEPEPRAASRARSAYGPDSEITVRPISTRPAPREQDPYAERRPAPPDADLPAIQPRARQGSAVRPVPPSAAPKAPHTVRPRRFDQAQEVADTFKGGQSVILNLQDVDRDLARRIIDFASGLCYALDGKLDKVANGVYLLTPGTLSPDERQMLRERDYD